MQVESVKIAFFRPIKKSPAPCRKFVSIRHGGPRPRQCVGGGIRGVINNFGGSQCLMITVTVQLTSRRLIVRKFVDSTHGIACALCDSCAYCNELRR